MHTVWRVFLGAFVVVPVAMVLAFPEADAGAVFVAGLVFVFLLAVLAFGLWKDYVVYFGGSSDAPEQPRGAGSGTEPDRALEEELCSDCGRRVPVGVDTCEDCATVGTWRK